MLQKEKKLLSGSLASLPLMTHPNLVFPVLNLPATWGSSSAINESVVGFGKKLHQKQQPLRGKASRVPARVTVGAAPGKALCAQQTPTARTATGSACLADNWAGGRDSEEMDRKVGPYPIE